MSAQSSTVKRVFILGHGGIVEEQNNPSQELIFFYVSEYGLLDRGLIPGFFETYDINPKLTMRQIVDASDCYRQYETFNPPIKERHRFEHVLFMEANSTMLDEPKYRRCSPFEKYGKEPEYKEMRKTFERETEAIENKITKETNLETLLKLKKLPTVEITPRTSGFTKVAGRNIEKMKFNVFQINKTDSHLNKDILIVPICSQTGCIYLSDIISWIRNFYPGSEIHWMACREYLKIGEE